jgi:LmbE family N-acetylglucosaminyl deacetylase
MSRSSRVLAVACFAALGSVLACGVGPQQPIPGPSVEHVVAQKPRVLWVAAHPDDESMAGVLLAKACVGAKSSCHFLVFNRGRGGECFLEDGCVPDLATVRHLELKRAARLYRSTLEHYDFYNAPLPVESFPSRTEIAARWMSEGDPVGLMARAVRRFKPDIVVTLDPYQGFTGHPEHQAAGRFALAGIRVAADENASSAYVRGEAPHRVKWVYHVLNKYWFMRLAGSQNDPKPYHETLDASASCGDNGFGVTRSCLEVRDQNTLVHHSQLGDMRAIRAMNPFWETVYLRRLDPFGDEASALVREIEELMANPATDPTPLPEPGG